MDSSSVWTQVWQQPFTEEGNRLDIERQGRTVRWRKIRERVIHEFGSFKGLRVIEIGAGRGIYSLLMALEGAEITLLDINSEAFKRAEEFFAQWKQKFHSVLADAFRLPKEMAGKFDIAMSYGFAEHFRYPERLQIFERHVDLVKPGGLIFVSVPNAAFLPYRIGKVMLERTNKWMFGLEIPFWRSELDRIGAKLALQNQKVFGSGWIGDFLNFWLIQRMLHVPGWAINKALGRKNATPLRDRFHYFPGNPATPLDDFLGYALVLTGERIPASQSTQ